MRWPLMLAAPESAAASSEAKESAVPQRAATAPRWAEEVDNEKNERQRAPAAAVKKGDAGKGQSVQQGQFKCECGKSFSTLKEVRVFCKGRCSVGS